MSSLTSYKQSPTEVITGIFIGLPVAIVINALITGWAITKLWAWFVVPQFGLGPLGIWGAYGLLLVVSMFQDSASKQRSNDAESVWGALVIAVLANSLKVGVLLLMGFVIRGWI